MFFYCTTFLAACLIDETTVVDGVSVEKKMRKDNKRRSETQWKGKKNM